MLDMVPPSPFSGTDFFLSSEICQENEIKVKGKERERERARVRESKREQQSAFNLNSFSPCEKATVHCKIFIFITVGIIIDGEALQANGKISLGGLNPDELSLHLAFNMLGKHGLSFPGGPADPWVQPRKEGLQGWIPISELGEVFQTRV